MNDVQPVSALREAPHERRRGPLWWRVLVGAVGCFVANRALAMAASLAFYTMLSLAPLLVLVVWLSTLTGYDMRNAVLEQIGGMAGPSARVTAAGIYDSARESPTLGSITGIASIVLALVGATTVFAQLQASLNRIWGIQARPGRALWGWLRRRILSIGVIAAVGFVLIVSLGVSAALGMVLAGAGPGWDALNQAISAAILAVLFAALFRYLPDTRLPWRTVLWGGLITSILFAIGKWAIGLYLASGSVGGAYGAASSLAVLLVWVYYSGAIFLFGAEVVRAWVRERGEPVPLEPHAEPVD